MDTLVNATMLESMAISDDNEDGTADGGLCVDVADTMMLLLVSHNPSSHSILLQKRSWINGNPQCLCMHGSRKPIDVSPSHHGARSLSLTLSYRALTNARDASGSRYEPTCFCSSSFAGFFARFWHHVSVSRLCPWSPPSPHPPAHCPPPVQHVEYSTVVVPP